jgi:uncharacterized membrane protein YqhA
MQTLKSKIIAFIWIISGVVLFGLIRRQYFHPGEFEIYIKLSSLIFVTSGILTAYFYFRDRK